MSGSKRKIYLAVGIFYEADRLNAASRSLSAWGFSHDDLWQAVPRNGPKGDGESVPARELTLTELQVDGAEPQAFSLAPRNDPPTFLLRSLMDGSLGAEIWQHITKGATVVLARTEGSDLHDQCVKVLLRNSQHTVHSLEINTTPDDIRR